MRGRWLVAWLAAVAVGVAACGDRSHETPTKSPFGSEAVAWREARYAAGRAGVENVSRFFDKHVVVEQRVLKAVFRDRRSYLKAFGTYLMTTGTGTSDPARPMGLLLSAEEMLDQHYNPGRVSWAPAADDWMALGTMGPHGYTHVVISASVEHWRSYLPTPAGLDRIEHLANRYVALWNGERGADAADVYGEGASVQDTLAGLSATGLRRIRAAVGSGEWPDLPHMETAVLPADPGRDGSTSRPPRGPAVYFGPAPEGTSETDEMVLLLQVDDGSGCPGLVGAAMGVDRGRIAWERRYHDVVSLRRCFDVDALERGWWQGIDIPRPVVQELTGTVRWTEPSRSVDVYNGTPAANEYVRWGLQRFAEAGLTLPKVDTVTFVRQQSLCSLGRLGYSRYDGSSGEVFLCFQPDQVDESLAERSTLLHELSHVWMQQNVQPSTEQAFMRLAGVSHWEDPDDDWDQRGVEQAANTMMFGLMNDPNTMDTAACEAFTARFRLLTAVDPLAPCSP